MWRETLDVLENNVYRGGTSLVFRQCVVHKQLAVREFNHAE